MASHNKNNTLPKRLAISAAVATTFLAGYGARQAYAGTCTGAAGTYTCSGAAAADSDQTLNSGTNPLSVTTNAGFGINVLLGNALSLRNAVGGTSIDFTDNNTSLITGAYNGISATNFGTGTTSITSTGTVTGTNYDGIYAFNNSAATGLTISTAAVTGAADGIFARNYGKGATSITSTGAVTGTNNDGIYARNNAATTGLTISTAAVTGGVNGIYARNYGTGATSITSTGTVTGTSGNGIYAANDTITTGLTISTAAVTAGSSGIFARNFGKGTTIITSTGTVTGTSNIGVYAFNSTNTTDLTINTAAVTSNNRGISAFNNGKGATIITSTGAVTGTNNIGVYAKNYTSTTGLTINTAAVTAGINGISAINFGAGATSITSTGTVTGVSNRGIYANNGTNAGSLTINAAAVTGGNNGIVANNLGTGATNITVSGAVTGGAKGAGIYSYNYNYDNTITLNSGASVSAASGNNAITLSSYYGTNSVTVNSGASVTGSVDLGGTGNTMTLNGGSLNVANGFALSVLGNLTNTNGIINLRNGTTIGAPANVSGDFTGGGQLLLNADFATDTADKLIIGGNVLAGGTSVGVNDVSTGPATGNAITLVSVVGTTTAGDFTLAAPVVNGAYNYNTLALVGQDWKLQSVAAGSGGAVFTPFAGSFEVMGQSLLTLANLPSLVDRTHGRIGGIKTGANSGDETGIDTPIWLRFTGGYRDIESNRSSTGANFDTNHWLAQAGIDFTLADNANGRFVAGVNAGYNKADTTIKSTAGKSNLDTTGHSIGLSGTWYGVNGVYVDTQLQRSWYNTDLSAGGVGAGNVNGIDGDGYSASIEAGKEIALNDSLNITPQAQLIYANVDSDDFTGANSEIVKLSTSKSLKARFGAALNKLFTPDGATRGFVVANVIREFEDETQVNVSGAQLTNAVDRWTGELGVGLNHAWTKGTTSYELTGAVTGSSSLNNFGNSKAAQGQVNFKVNF